MIEGLEAIYERIADAIVSAIPDQWNSARIDAVFYSDSSEYTGEYLTDSGIQKDFAVALESTRAFRELRRKFKEAGQPLWGQASFELNADGKFKMKWGYENCDENGDTVWDEAEWHRHQEERRQRLSQQ